MAISIPTGASNVTTASIVSASSVAITKPSGISDGDWLCAAVYFRNGGGTITAPAGWTQIFADAGSWTQGMFVKRIPSAVVETAPSYTFSTSAGMNRLVGSIFRIAGGAASEPLLDVAGVLSSIAQYTSVNVPGITTTMPNDALLVMTVTHNGAPAIIPSMPAAGWADVTQVDVASATASSSMSVYTRQAPSAGATGNAIFPIDGTASNAGGFMVSLESAPVTVAITNSLQIVLRG